MYRLNEREHLLYSGQGERCLACDLESWPAILTLRQNQRYPPIWLGKLAHAISILAC